MNETLHTPKDDIVDMTVADFKHVVHAVGCHHQAAGVVDGDLPWVLQRATCQRPLVVEATLLSSPGLLPHDIAVDRTRGVLQARLVPSGVEHATEQVQHPLSRTHDEGAVNVRVPVSDLRGQIVIKRRGRQSKGSHHGLAARVEALERRVRPVDMWVLVHVGRDDDRGAAAAVDDLAIPLVELGLGATPVADVAVHDDDEVVGRLLRQVLHLGEAGGHLREEALPRLARAEVVEASAFDAIHREHLLIAAGLHCQNRRCLLAVARRPSARRGVANCEHLTFGRCAMPEGDAALGQDG
mmetsp:Transcript_23675/g.68009  ORF Transcript_23675/g.68009 Transcript_23675/m.68009 type:complete len:297 (+) Transcript_23675:230-1120(+)